LQSLSRTQNHGPLQPQPPALHFFARGSRRDFFANTRTKKQGEALTISRETPLISDFGFLPGLLASLIAQVALRAATNHRSPRL
jgi:hypothetical protein